MTIEMGRMWIYEHKDWPHFTWDSATLINKLADVRHLQGLVLGRTRDIDRNLKLRTSVDTLTEDTVKSSAIEGHQLDPDEVRSSVAHYLNVETHREPVSSSQNVKGKVKVQLNATQQFSEPLTKERLLDWYLRLFPDGFTDDMYPIKTPNDWREIPMRVVTEGERIGSADIVHYTAPSADRVSGEMQNFLDWFNDRHDMRLNGQEKLDPILKAGIAHLWFVTIHPFEDGNGRIARAIADLALARADRTEHRFYSMSRQIENEKNEYYSQLEKQQHSAPEITGWLKWFLECLERTLLNQNKTLKRLFFNTRFLYWLKKKSFDGRQYLVINHMLDNPVGKSISTSEYAALAKCSNDTARRDIQDLVACGVFVKNPSGGRSTSYRLIGEAELPRD